VDSCSQVESEEEEEEEKGPTPAVRVAKIISAKKHPKADKLQICEVEFGASKPVQVVCGAPNARAGLVTILACVGATVPMNGMTLTQCKLRGVESFGMLCSAVELGWAAEADGIVELDEKDFTIGDLASKTAPAPPKVEPLAAAPAAPAAAEEKKKKKKGLFAALAAGFDAEVAQKEAEAAREAVAAAAADAHSFLAGKKKKKDRNGDKKKEPEPDPEPEPEPEPEPVKEEKKEEKKKDPKKSEKKAAEEEDIDALMAALDAAPEPKVAFYSTFSECDTVPECDLNVP
jgi:tRNA-binding EMAP/Myf-like protein